MAAQATAAREQFNTGVEKLKALTVAQAIDYITKSPYALAEMLVVAEMLYGNRKGVLDRFGPPDPGVVKRWTDINDGKPDTQTGGLGAQPTITEPIEKLSVKTAKAISADGKE